MLCPSLCGSLLLAICLDDGLGGRCLLVGPRHLLQHLIHVACLLLSRALYIFLGPRLHRALSGVPRGLLFRVEGPNRVEVGELALLAAFGCVLLAHRVVEVLLPFLLALPLPLLLARID